SSNKGKVPVPVLRFRAPVASAPPPPCPSYTAPLSPHRSERRAHYTAPLPPPRVGPTTHYPVPPAPSASYATPPGPDSYYAPLPQHQYVRPDPAALMTPAVAPPVSPSMTRDEVTVHVQDLLSKSIPDPKARSVVDYCKLPPVYFPPGFKAPKYRKY